MVFGFIKNLLDDNAKEIKRLQKTVDIINSLEKEIENLSDEELRNKTFEFKKRYQSGTSLDDLLPEAFAVVREASKRVLKMRHFDVQLMGGIVLHQGRIAEMKTGEGKTLVATLPAYLNALAGKGVHVITVNDYLAKRDSEWMGQIYRFLGLEVGLIVHGLEYEERRAAYAADITYGTNNEFGFDYLRDNMVMYKEHMVQRDLHYAIIDEVDSILIDEARTPLIISGSADKPTELYKTVAKIIPRLKNEEDYTIDEKQSLVTLTEQGVSRVEKMLGIDNLADEKNMEISHHVNQALKAHTLMKRDRDYVVKDGEVIIVDEFTGRLMFGRRYSEGLHQAIEAKEGVKIERESQTLATITFQNYFRMYNKLSGMTGTAKTEEEEFIKIYGMDVVVIPTNKPMIREDKPDVVYRTEMGKFNAVVDEIVARHNKGQPLLVGTVSIEKSELLSNMLKKKGIPHQVLNAKYHEQEAEIVAQAGQKGMVTIATNMAGRGTDIVLGPGVKELGGLCIIGTERHEARRIDNQLRGRSGRQGDPGVSQFYISLEDDLMRLFGSENILGLMDKLGMDDTIPIENAIISRGIENAQKRVEARNFDIRKHVLEYDDVMNKQREVIYSQRRKVLIGENIKESILDMIEKVVDRTVDSFAGEIPYPEEWDLQGLLNAAEQSFLPNHKVKPELLANMEAKEVRDFLKEEAFKVYQAREEELGEENLREMERLVLLKVVDAKWMDHLDAMDQLRQGIYLRAYGQRDPLTEYKFEAYDMFNQMIEEIQQETVRYIYRVNIVERPEERTDVVENKYAEEQLKTPVKSEKIGRNEPCPCGSGKKYKKCCGRA
ncbi:MAG: preprotein translocase subunit SecA [Clostridia bacterium]|jgi:preprotein translocase subunit SecA|nr:preprotein translocase subunit SecA [Clostridia bacterium]MDN5323297.1 preprotein translocase subunit SecA [Clostridia bacterium]